MTHKIALVGAGKMGGAMLTGWIAGGLPETEVVVADPHPGDDARAAIDAGALQTAELTKAEAKDLETLFLAIKPQMFDILAPGIAHVLPAGTRVISVLAGTTLAAMERVFGDRPLIRCMPNTPASIGKGVTAYVGNAAAGERDFAAAETLLRAGGQVVCVDDENLIDVVTGVSGSGPAYIFHMVEALSGAAEAAGMPADMAMTLARQTVVGSAALLDASDKSAKALREAVTSPNGTTQAGLDVLMNVDGLPKLMRETVKAAVKRSRELGA